MIRSTGVPFAIAWPWARCVDAITSSRRSAAQTPVAVASCADRDVQEPGQLAGAEAVLDLLLEPADEQHLAEEPAQHFPGDRLPSGLDWLFDGRHRAAIMLIRRCGPSSSGRRSRRASRPTGRRHSSHSSPKARWQTPPRFLGPLQPGRVGDALRLHVPRADGGVERARNIFRRLDGRRIWGDAGAHRGQRGCVRRSRRRGPRPPRHVAGSRAGTRALAAAPARLERPSLHARARLERPPPPGRPAGRAHEPVAGAVDAIALQFRASGKQGYGVVAAMARRCFERMDAEGITGRISVLRALGHGERRDAGPGLAPRGTLGLAADSSDDPRGAAHAGGHAGRRGIGAFPSSRASLFHVCVPT